MKPPTEASRFLSFLLDTDDALSVVMGGMLHLLPNLWSLQLLASECAVLQEFFFILPLPSSRKCKNKKVITSNFMTFCSLL